MKVHVELPESLAAQARDLAEREQIGMDSLIASALEDPHCSGVKGKGICGKSSGSLR